LHVLRLLSLTPPRAARGLKCRRSSSALAGGFLDSHATVCRIPGLLLNAERFRGRFTL
jgi:hypothetical protein